MKNQIFIAVCLLFACSGCSLIPSDLSKHDGLLYIVICILTFPSMWVAAFFAGILNYLGQCALEIGSALWQFGLMIRGK